VFCLMPQKNWGVLGGLVITAICPVGQLHAAQEPIMRVLVLESKQLRFRADGDKPLLVFGIGLNKKRISTLKIRQRNGRFQIAINGSSSRWSYLPGNADFRIRSKDPRGIWLGKRRYRGELRILLTSNRIQVVNHLGVEKYLSSVVGSEMPKSWPMAALQAQAIAARTYALQQGRKKKFYDVNSTEKSQVYLGIESETKSTRKAVESTRALVLIHKGRLIDAVFHSSSGGFTEASGAVWKKQLPYLVGVPDYDQHSPSYKWKKEFDPYQLEAAFSETGGVDRVQILNSSNTGRVLRARVDGPRGELEITGRELRSRLALKSTLASFEMTPYEPMLNKKLSKKKLSSRDVLRNWSLTDPGFDLPINALTAPPPLTSPQPFPTLPPLFAMKKPPRLPPIAPKRILLVRGSGSGHGVGMSQWGAHGLAEKGADFRKILTHYYKGVDIRRFSST